MGVGRQRWGGCREGGWHINHQATRSTVLILLGDGEEELLGDDRSGCGKAEWGCVCREEGGLVAHSPPGRVQRSPVEGVERCRGGRMQGDGGVGGHVAGREGEVWKACAAIPPAAKAVKKCTPDPPALQSHSPLSTPPPPPHLTHAHPPPVL